MTASTAPSAGRGSRADWLSNPHVTCVSTDLDGDLVKVHPPRLQRQPVQRVHNLRSFSAAGLGVAVAPRLGNVLQESRLKRQRFSVARMVAAQALQQAGETSFAWSEGISHRALSSSHHSGDNSVP